jgi:hypothetical protein
LATLPESFSFLYAQKNLYHPKKDRTDFRIKNTNTYLRIHKNVYLVQKKCVFVILGWNCLELEERKTTSQKLVAAVANSKT